jgi:cutinase
VRHRARGSMAGSVRRNGGWGRLLAVLVAVSLVGAAVALVPRAGSVTGRLLGASGSSAGAGPGGTSAVQAAAATPADAGAGCSGVYFVSARGSGQPYGKPGETAAEEASDISVTPQTNAVLTALQANLPKNVPVTAHQLSYPAPAVSVLGTGISWSASAVRSNSEWDTFMHVNLPKYIGDEQQGESELVGYLSQIYFNCYPKGQEPMVVLAGYSQGAMVVHNILNELAAYPNTALSLIKGAVLIADPERMPWSNVTNFGSAPDGDYGLCRALDEFLIPHEKTSGSCVPPNTTTDVARSLSSEVYQVCDAGDVACDTSGAFRLNSHGVPALTDGILFKRDWKKLKQDYESGKLIHTTHYKHGAVTTAARRVARNLVRDGVGTVSVPSVSPSSTPSPTPTSSGAGAVSWRALTAPTPGGATSGTLESVTCPSTTCVAAGWDSKGILIVSGSGSSWTATDTPGPVSTEAGGSVDPWSGPYVACAAPSACTAVGYYQDHTGGPTHGYLVTGGVSASWIVRQPPLPANAAADGDVELRAVACPSPKRCVAVGVYQDSSYNTEGLVLTGSGSSWQATEAPLPTDAATNHVNTELWSVACSSASHCVIGGGYAVAGATPQSLPGYANALILTGSGSSWTPSAPPVPANAIADASNLGVASLITQVTCPVSECVAVGSYMDTTKAPEAMVLTESGTSSWSAVEPPLPGTSGTGQGSELIGFGCASASACTGWGMYDLTAGKPQVMTVTGSGMSWQSDDIANAASSVSADTYPYLACLSVDVCTALDPYDATPGLLITGSGSTWTTTTAPLPSDAQSTGARLSAIACSPAQCVSVGSYYNSADNEVGLLEIGQSQ